MDLAQNRPSDAPLASEQALAQRADQALRKQRLKMSVFSYLVTASLVLLCWYLDLAPAIAVIQYLIFCVLINGLFWAMISSGFNLRFRDPSMTALQMVVSVLPALWVMYFLDAGQARASFLLIITVPALYGILALNIRQFLVVGFFFFSMYGVFMAVMWWSKPELLDPSLELFQLLALLLVMAEIAIIGGFIHSLREKLRLRNSELKQTMGELQEAMAKISDMAHRDALTGLFNRRHLFDVLSKEANRQRRANGPFSVCILDVDHFKHVNDRYGHGVGDEVLKRIAESVEPGMRNIDCFGRYGGEEFLMVLPQTTAEGAGIKAERVRATVEALRFPTVGDDFRVTVSIGIAEHLAEEIADDTICRADAALYQAKAGGRNRVVIAGSPAAVPES